MFDPFQFMSVEMRWGREGEMAEVLDWRKIVRIEGQGQGQGQVDGLQYGYDHGSHMPGAD